MNCIETKQAIDQMPEHSLLEGALAQHLNQCELCQHYYGERLLERELAAFEVPEPAPDFLLRAIKCAVEQPSGKKPNVQMSVFNAGNWRWPSAAVASILALVMGMHFFGEASFVHDLQVHDSQVNDSLVNNSAVDDAAVEDAAPIAEPQSEDLEYQRDQIRIVIYSKEDRDKAELSIELAEDLELEGYAGKQRLAWNTKLSKGKNVLTIPVLVRNKGGEVRVTSHFGDASHEVKIQVPKRDTSADSKLEQIDKQQANKHGRAMTAQV